MNDFVIDILIDIIFTEKNYKRIIKAVNEKIDKNNSKSANKKKGIKNEIVQLDFAINKLTDVLIQSNNIDGLTAKLKELEKKRTRLENKYESYDKIEDKVTKDEINKVKKKFKKYLLKKDLPVCRKLIRSFIEKIVVYNDRVEVVVRTSSEHRKEHSKSA